jgi:DNA helicase HerA-like ATPase
MELTKNPPIGIVLQKGDGNSVRGILSQDAEVNMGQLLVIQDNERISLGRIESFEYINNFFSEDSELIRPLTESSEIYDLLSSSTVTRANLFIIRRYSHNSTPKPGSLIRTLPEIRDEDLPEFYGIPGLCGYIKYGRLAGSSIPLLLDLNSITMHAGIFGETGSGKSYNMRYLLYNLSNIKIGEKEDALPIILIDANGDYSDFTYTNSDMLRGRKWIKRYVLRDPLLPNDQRLTIDLSLFSPRDLAEFITSLKYGQTGGNALQSNFLEYVLSLHDQKEFNFLLGTTTGLENLKQEVNEVSSNKELGFNYSTSRSVQSALEIFKNKVVNKLSLVSPNASLTENTLELMWRSRGLATIDFSADASPGIDVTTKQLIVSYVSRITYNYLTRTKYSGSQRFIIFIIEEAQNYIPSNDYPVNANLTKDVLVTLATQGRKFGLSLILVSQRPAFIDKYVLSMLNTFFFHRIYHEDVRYVMSASGGLPESLSHALTSLETGYAIVNGLMSSMKSPVLVRIPWDSRLGSYAGSVERVERVLTTD